jgi:hypothetical protein
VYVVDDDLLMSSYIHQMGAVVYLVISVFGKLGSV